MTLFLSAEHPFPGLRPFDYGDAPYFFGRNEHVSSLYGLLEMSHLIAVIGSSGSGKSSLVRAGLLPLLQQESEDEAGRKWRVAVMTPGDHPVANLAEALSRHTHASADEAARATRFEKINAELRRSRLGLSRALKESPELEGGTLLLVVDQFEEIFRFGASDEGEGALTRSLLRDEATFFVQLLLEGARTRAENIFVLLTMRSDFIGDCARFDELPEAVSAGQFLTPGLKRAERVQAIRGPIEKAGATIEPELVQLLVSDLGVELDQLPVLQHCLSRIWEKAGEGLAPGAQRHLTRAHYDAVDRLSGALSQHANQISAELPGLDLAVEQVFRALSERDKEGRATRRALPLEQLEDEAGVSRADLLKVINRFRADDCSFILPSPERVPELAASTRIDVVHEALLRRWTKISSEAESVGGGKEGWLAAEDEDGRIFRALRDLTTSAKGGDILPAEQVDARVKWWHARPRTVAWCKRYGGGYTLVEDLLARSLKNKADVESARAAAAERDRQRETAERERAEKDRLDAERRERERLESEAKFARMQSEAAQRETENAQKLALAARSFANRTRAFAGLMALLFLFAAGVAAYAALENRKLAAAEVAARAAESNAKGAEQKAVASEQKAVASEKKAVASEKKARGEERVAKSEAHEAQVARAAAAKAAVAAALSAEHANEQAKLARQNEAVANAATKLADSQTKLARTNLQAANTAKDRADYQATLAKKNEAEARDSQRLAFKAAGLAAVDALRSGQNASAVDAAILLAAAYGANPAGRPEDQETYDALKEALRRLPVSVHAHDTAVDALAVSPAGYGPFVATATGSSPVRLWDRSGRLLHVFTDQDNVSAVAFSPRQPALVTASVNKLVLRPLTGMKMASAPPPVPLQGLETGSTTVLRFSRDGGKVLAAGDSGLVVSPVAAAGKPCSVRGPVEDALFSHNGQSVVASMQGGGLTVVDLTNCTATHKLLASNQLALLAGAANAPLVVAADGNSVYAYNTETQKLEKLGDAGGSIADISVDRGGDEAVAVLKNGETVLIGNGGKTRAIGSGPAAFAKFSPVNESVAVVGPNGTVEFANTSGGAASGERTPRERPRVVRFSPDGSTLAVGDVAGNLVLWQAAPAASASEPSKVAPIAAISLDATGRHAVSRSGSLGENRVQVWSLQNGIPTAEGAPLAVTSDPGTRVVAARLDADGQRLVTAAGSSVKIWSLDANGRPKTAPVTIAAAKTGEYFSDASFATFFSQPVVVGSERAPYGKSADFADQWWAAWKLDGTQLLREESEQTEIQSLEVSHDAESVVAFSNDSVTYTRIVGATTDTWFAPSGGGQLTGAAAGNGRLYATGDSRGRVAVYSYPYNRVVFETSTGSGRINALRFSDDNNWLASAGANGDVYVWEVESGTRQARFSAGSSVKEVAFSPNGSDFVLTLTEDGRAQLWGRESQRAIAALPAPGIKVSTAAFSADGSTVVLGGEDGRIYARTLGVTNLPKKEDTARLVLDSTGIRNKRPAELSALICQAAARVMSDAKEAPNPFADCLGGTVGRGLQALNARNAPAMAASNLLPEYLFGGNDGGGASLRVPVGSLIARFTGMTSTLAGSTGDLDSLTFVDGGKEIVAGGDDNRAVAWDVRSGSVVMSDRFDDVASVIAEHDGPLAFVRRYGDTNLRAWNLATRTKPYTMRAPAGRIWGYATISPDDRVLATVSHDTDTAKYFLNLWKTADGKPLAGRSEYPLADSPTTIADNGRLVALGYYGKAELIERGTGKRVSLNFAPLGSLDKDVGNVDRIRVRAADDTIVTLRAKKLIEVWDKDRPQRPVRALDDEGNVASIALAERGNLVAISGDDGVDVWDFRTGKTKFRESGEGRADLALFSRDGKLLFEVRTKRSVIVRSVDDWRVLGRITTDVDQVAIPSAADTIATSVGGGDVNLWQVAAVKPLSLSFDAPATRDAREVGFDDIRLSADGSRLLAVTTGAGNALLWDVSDPSQHPWVLPIGAPVSNGSRATFLRDPVRLSVVSSTLCGKDRHVATFDLRRHMQCSSVLVGDNWTRSPSGRFLAWTSGKKLAVLDLQNGSVTEFPTANVPDRIAFGTSDDVLIYGSASEAKIVTREGRELFSPAGDARQIKAALSRDHRRLLVFGGEADTATLWDVSTPGHPTDIQTLLPPGSGIDFAMFSPSDDLIVARDRYGRISLWSGSGEPRTFLGSPDTRVESIQFSDDGAYLVAQTNHGAEVWDRFGRALVTLPYSEIQRIATAANEIAVARDRSVQVYSLQEPTPGSAQNLRVRLALTLK